jgi:hypothetical protein
MFIYGLFSDAVKNSSGMEVWWVGNEFEIILKGSGYVTLFLICLTTPYRHLWADCLENVGASTSHNSMGLHGLLHG